MDDQTPRDQPRDGTNASAPDEAPRPSPGTASHRLHQAQRDISQSQVLPGGGTSPEPPPSNPTGGSPLAFWFMATMLSLVLGLGTLVVGRSTGLFAGGRGEAAGAAGETRTAPVPPVI